jgi:hypothetical protein
VYGRNLSLAVVDAVDGGRDSDGVEETILVSEHPSRTNNRRVRERLLDSLLTLELGAVECRLRVGVGVEVRDVDEAGNAGVVGDASDTASSGDVNILEGEVPVGEPGQYIVCGCRRGRKANLVV